MTGSTIINIPHSERGRSSSILVSQAIFLLTGIISTLGYQYVVNHGAAEKTTLIPVAANYYGMAISIFVPMTKGSPVPTSTSSTSFFQTIFTSPYTKIVATLAAVEFLGSAAQVLGIIYAGSGLYQVVYSAVVVLTAIWARIFLKKVLTSKQWYAILTVTFGLILSTLGGIQVPQHSSKDATAVDNQTQYVALGLFFTFSATIFYSIYYTLSEKYLTGKHAIPAHQLQSQVGFFAVLYITIYELLYTLPRFATLVTDNVNSHGGNWGTIIGMYLILVISAFAHAVTFYQLVGAVGAVSTGILQSLRAVSVFILSAILFCDENHQNQCYNKYKGLSTCVVVVGIIWFASQQKKEIHEKSDDSNDKE